MRLPDLLVGIPGEGGSHTPTRRQRHRREHRQHHRRHHTEHRSTHHRTHNRRRRRGDSRTNGRLHTRHFSDSLHSTQSTNYQCCFRHFPSHSSDSSPQPSQHQDQPIEPKYPTHPPMQRPTNTFRAPPHFDKKPQDRGLAQFLLTTI